MTLGRAMMKGMARNGLCLWLAALLIAVAAPAAMAQDGPGGSNGHESQPVLVTVHAAQQVNTFGAARDATGREHPVYTESDPPCAIEEDYQVLEIGGEDDFGIPYFVYVTRTRCIAWFFCESERIDNLLSGAVSGSESGGGYGEWLSVIEGYAGFAASQLGFSEGIDIDALSDTLIDSGLGPPGARNQLPFFHFCRIEYDEDNPSGTGAIAIAGSAEAPDAPPTFSWQSNLETEYNISVWIDSMVDEVIEDLQGAVPEIRAIPPIEGGRTFVKFPTWLWLDEPLVANEMFALSDLNTIRVSARAALNEVVFTHGDGELPCVIDDMQIWVEGVDPFDAPECHVVFDELQSFELTATAYYDVEYRVQMRMAPTAPWPNTAWQDGGTEEVTGTAGQIDVRELVAVNVADTVSG